MKQLALAWLCSFAIACASNPSGERTPDPGAEGELMGRLVDVRFEVEGAPRRAALYVPAGYEASDSRWPLIVFLHGLGERGDDARAQTTVGIYSAIKAHPERFPCLVLMPQCPLDRVWVTLSASWANGIPDAEDHIEAALAATLAQYRVDPSRIALTGLSMGGFGTLVYGAKHVDRYRALVAVCGGGRAEDAAALATRPLWLLHGDADPIVPPQSSQDMHDSVKAAGGDVTLTFFPGVGHNSWDRAYEKPEVIAFLLR